MSLGSERGTGCRGLATALAIVLAGVAIWRGYATWPHIPMDISAGDPATQAAFQAVVRNHVIVHGLGVLAACVLGYMIGRLLCRPAR